MTCKSPIDIITTSATPDSNGLLFNYSGGDYTSALGSNANIPFIKLTPKKNKNTVTYKKNTYTLTELRLYKNSIHTIDGKFFAGELVMIHTSDTNLKLFICIPVSLTTDINKSSFGNILKKIPSTDNISPKTFIPTNNYSIKSFYSYYGTNLYDCKHQTEYIIFASSNVKITPAEFNGVKNNTFRRLVNTKNVIYSHHTNQVISADTSKTPTKTPTTNKPLINEMSTIGSLVSSGNNAVSFGDDNIYIDCQSVDAPESITSSSAVPAQSINFSNLQNNKLIQMLLMFIIFMIVMVIFFYSYEFTTGMFRELTKSVAKMNPL